MTDDEIKESIKREEGLRLNVYRDSLGNLTVGYGHLLRVGSIIPQFVADALFEFDYDRACKDYETLKLDLDPVRRGVIIDMIFNIGIGNLLDFKKMLAHLRNKNWIQAAYEMMESQYAKQVPERAKRNRDKILRGR
jgi:lysozyme